MEIYSIIQQWKEGKELCHHFIEGLTLESARDWCKNAGGIKEELSVDVSGFYNNRKLVETWKVPENKIYAIVIPNPEE